MVDVTSLPGTKGDRVLAQYVGGKGKGKHYYKGVATKYNYRVISGEYYYVDPADASDGSGVVNSLFVRVNRDVAELASKPKVVETLAVEPPIKLSPRVAPVEKTPVSSRFFKKEAEEALPDINNLRWSQEIRHMEFTPSQAKQLIKIEEAGKNRAKVLGHLKKYA